MGVSQEMEQVVPHLLLGLGGCGSGTHAVMAEPGRQASLCTSPLPLLSDCDTATWCLPALGK